MKEPIKFIGNIPFEKRIFVRIRANQPEEDKKTRYFLNETKVPKALHWVMAALFWVLPRDRE